MDELKHAAAHNAMTTMTLLKSGALDGSELQAAYEYVVFNYGHNDHVDILIQEAMSHALYTAYMQSAKHARTANRN